MRMLVSLMICCMLCVPLCGAEDITIRNRNTDNPTLLYKHKPMLKTGPICERRVFMHAIGSDFFDHEAWFDYMDTFSLCDYPNRRLHYLWMGMMTKIQALGLYEKENHTQADLLAKPQARELGKYNLTLMRFFTNEIKDYALLDNKNDVIKKAPPVTRKVALSSAIETIVYLHKGFEQGQEAGAGLELGNLSLPDGSVLVRFVHPNTGRNSAQRASVKNASLTLTLPEFYENLAVAIAANQKTEYTLKRENQCLSVTSISHT